VTTVLNEYTMTCERDFLLKNIRMFTGALLNSPNDNQSSDAQPANEDIPHHKRSEHPVNLIHNFIRKKMRFQLIKSNVSVVKKLGSHP